MYNANNYNSPYGNNMATSFLDQQVQSSFNQGAYGQSGGLQGQFANVMSSMAGSVNQNAQVGMMPGQGGRLSTQQIAAQMNMAGPMSVLPHLGGSLVPKVIFPLAGLWSMVDGVRAYRSMRTDLAQNQSQRFDPNQLNYESSLNQLYEANSQWGQLGPFSTPR